VAAVLAAALIAVPILRLKGIYIVLVSFAFSQLVLQLIISESAYTGGNSGLVRVPMLAIPGHNMVRDGKLGYYYIALALLGCCVVFLRGFVRSPLGRSIVALRDNEEYAVSRGVSLGRQRLITLGASALFTGIAGAFYGGYFRNASTDVFGMSLTTLILSMVLLGGRVKPAIFSAARPSRPPSSRRRRRHDPARTIRHRPSRQTGLFRHGEPQLEPRSDRMGQRLSAATWRHAGGDPEPGRDQG
jgi:branched-subunit amino acid ABC-type transport system permease component